MIASTPIDILRFLLARADEDLATVLVTLTGIEGSASRAIGAQMAVAEDGSYRGSFSGGCIEAAIVAEAFEVLASGRARLVRYGVNSPYIDIRLPCGGGIDLLFNPRPDRDAIAFALARLDLRVAAGLRLSLRGVEIFAAAKDSVGRERQSGSIDVDYVPPMRILAVGHGDDLIAFARLAEAFGAQVVAVSPDARARDELMPLNGDIVILPSRMTLPKIQTDPWTAIIFLFHDRDWEEALLPQALGLPSFYVGAVGSGRTHAARLERLRAAGLPAPMLAKLRGRIGLIPGARDPATLAISILSEIVEEYHLLSAPLPQGRALTGKPKRAARPVSYNRNGAAHAAGRPASGWGGR